MFKFRWSHLKIDVGLHVCLEHRKPYESVLRCEGHRMVNRVVPLLELAGDSDNGRDALVRGLMAPGIACDLQVRVPVEPDLLQLAYEVRYVLARVKVSTYVESTEFQDALLPQLRLRYMHNE